MSGQRVNRELTNEEMSALSQFKKQLEDLDLTNPILEDRRLINWLRARELRIPDAESMLRKHLEWRQENKIDTILTSGVVNIEDPLLAPLPIDIVGHSKEGNTIMAVYCGALEIKKVLQAYGKEMGVHIILYLLEVALEDVTKQSNNVKYFKRADYICDMEGIKFKEFMSPDVLEVMISALKNLEANYPEILNKAYILNAPFIFPILWNVLKPFMSEATLGKINIVGQNQEKIEKCLFEHISSDQLPRKWGGTGFSERIPDLNVSSSSSKNNVANDMGMQETVIPAGESFEMSFEVESPKALLCWTFKTKHYDIGFSLVHKPLLFMENQNEACNTKERVTYKRINAQKSVHSGSLVCEMAGQYILRFDNTYSRLREKTLLYHVEMSQLTTNGNIGENSQDANIIE